MKATVKKIALILGAAAMFWGCHSLGLGRVDQTLRDHEVKPLFEGGFAEIRVFSGQIIVLERRGKSQAIPVKILNQEVVLDFPGGPVAMRQGYEAFLDLEGDGLMDFRFYLQDWLPSDPTKGAAFRLESILGPADLQYEQQQQERMEEQIRMQLQAETG